MNQAVQRNTGAARPRARLWAGLCLVRPLPLLPPTLRLPRGLLSWLAWLLALVALPAQAYEDFSIEATSRDGAVVLNVQARISARHAAIWNTLTDYDGLPRFVPCITTSRVIERRGAVSVVEQKGSAQVLFFSYPVEVTVETRESAPDTLSVRVLKGNLRQLEGAYRLTRVPGKEDEYVLSWRGLIEPDFSVPAFITVPLMRASFREQFLAMVAEIERRELAMQGTGTQSAAGSKAPGGTAGGS